MRIAYSALRFITIAILWFAWQTAVVPSAYAQASTGAANALALGLDPGQRISYGDGVGDAAGFGDSLEGATAAGRLYRYETYAVNLHGDSSATTQLVHASRVEGEPLRLRRVPMWLSVVPPLIAIALALLFKEVISSLFFGILVGAFIAGGMRIESLYYVLRSVWDVASGFIIAALNDAGHLSVVVFSILVGGMVSIVSRNGGMAGVVSRLAVIAKDRISAMLSTYILGIAIFFDDYANTLIVGNTMREVTDRFGVSREKLAYLVDATAAPIASVAFITTWIGAELDYIDGGLQAIAGFPLEVTPYAVFLESLKFSFYPVLTLLFLALLIRSGRDYGPMYVAEARALQRLGEKRAAVPVTSIAEVEDVEEADEFKPVPGAPLKARYAVLPVATVLAVVMYGLLDTGLSSLAEAVSSTGRPAGTLADLWAGIGYLDRPDGSSLGFFRKLGVVIGASDSYVALLWASLSGVLMAAAMTVGARVMSLEKTMASMLHGFGSMLPALVILTLAWALASATEALHTADFLTEALQGRIAPVLLPAIVFVMAALISFSTGSSWSTMAILYPIMIPATWQLAVAAGFDESHAYALLLNVIATVLSASVLGDHCSPISDTTILSSLASRCDHLQHVRTQIPYVLTVGAFALIAKLITAYFDGGWPLSFLIVGLSAASFFAIIKRFGREPHAVPTR